MSGLFSNAITAKPEVETISAEVIPRATKHFGSKAIDRSNCLCGVAWWYQLSQGLCVLQNKLTHCPSSLGGQQVLANPDSSIQTTGKPKTLLSFL